MKKDEPKSDSLGAYLKRLRESKGLSLREAARQAGISSAYLSQVEGGKRGKRKGGEDFGPHPQILKKLAEAYNIPANELFTRAGYIEDSQNTKGFSEERETNRLFDFVIHDAMLKDVFTTLDKRAVINRYEALTGRRLITWAGERDLSPTVANPEFQGLRCDERMLYAETPFTYLSLEEVAQELGTSVEEIETIIANGWLDGREDAKGQFFITKSSLRGFKDEAMRDGLQMCSELQRSRRPSNAKQFKEVKERLEKINAKRLPDVIRRVTEEAFKSVQSKKI